MRASRLLTMQCSFDFELISISLKVPGSSGFLIDLLDNTVVGVAYPDCDRIPAPGPGHDRLKSTNFQLVVDEKKSTWARLSRSQKDD